jgi:chromate transporter
MSDRLGTLFGQFALMSLVAVGGANAVLPRIHGLAVGVEGWMTDREFADLFAIANAAPGPNVLIVSLIGFKVAGVSGALAATLGMCGPSSLLSYGFSRLWYRIRARPWVMLAKRSMAPVTVGLIIASGFVLARAADQSWLQVGLGLVTAGIVVGTKLNPLWMLGAAAALGLAGIG